MGTVGLIFLIAVAHVMRMQGGLRAEGRFWIQIILFLAGFGAADFLALWLLPERYQTIASSMVSGTGFVTILYVFGRYKQPSA